MKLNKKYFFVFGMVLFYLIILLSPNKPIYFSAYLISTFFFYLARRNIRESLVYSLILSLFSEVNMAGSWFLLNPVELYLRSGYWITPTTLLILCLLLLSLGKKVPSFRFHDVIVSLFFLWNIIIFILFPNANVLFGILCLLEVCLVYYILRIYVSKNNIRIISYIILTALIFQTFVGLLQLISHKPVGSIAEAGTVIRPYGITTPEDSNLFRLSGSFVHPNSFSAFLLATLPFLLLFPVTSILLYFFIVLSIIVLFFTYTRSAWIIFAITVFLLLATRQIHFKIPSKISHYFYPLTLLFVLIFIYLLPFFNARLDTFQLAFEDGGSWSTRVKLMREGLSIVLQYPLTGVGLNQSLQYYSENPTTNLFEKITPSSSYRIHNTFLEMAAEIGIPGLLLFVWFLLLVLKKYLKEKPVYPRNAAFFGLIGLIGLSMFNPFLYSSQFQLFFLLSSILIV